MPSVIEMEVRKTKAIRTPRRTLSRRVAGDSMLYQRRVK